MTLLDMGTLTGPLQSQSVNVVTVLQCYVRTAALSMIVLPQRSIDLNSGTHGYTPGAQCSLNIH